MAIASKSRFAIRAAGRAERAAGAGKGCRPWPRRCPARSCGSWCAPGDAVEAGQGIVVVEAMKMQNEMKAAAAGKVLSVAVKEGATVAAGEILATIE